MQSVILITIATIFASAGARTTGPEGNGCITGINLYAGTGGIPFGDSNGWFYYELEYRTQYGEEKTYSVELYDRPGDDMMLNKGDFYTFTGLHSCISLHFLHGRNSYIKPKKGNFDSWLVEDAIVYGEIENDPQNLMLISHNVGVKDWAKDKLFGSDEIVPLQTSSVLFRNCGGEDQCITNIYIMADTGDKRDAGSDDSHNFLINDYSFLLYDLPGNDMLEHKSDLWKFSASDIGVPADKCLRFGEVTRASFVARGKDAWLIENAMVSVELESGKHALLAGRRSINELLETDKPERHHVELDMKNHCQYYG